MKPSILIHPSEKLVAESGSLASTSDPSNVNCGQEEARQHLETNESFQSQRRLTGRSFTTASLQLELVLQ